MGSKGAVRDVRRLEKSRDVIGVIAVLTQSRHRDDVDVQAACLRVLGNVCHDAENRRLAGRSGAIEAVVDAVNRHGGKEHVQEMGVRQLSELCRYGDENGRLAGRCGAIEAVVHAMKRHGGNEKLQEKGCALVRMCLGNDENARLAGRSGAIEAVVHAMKRHGGSEDVQYSGCWALNNMCYGNAENARLAGRYGAIQAVVDAMKRHRGNENVQKKGYGNFVASWLCVVVASWLWWLRRTNKSPTRR